MATIDPTFDPPPDPTECPSCHSAESLHVKGPIGHREAYCYADTCNRMACVPVRTVRFTRYTDSGTCDVCGMSMFDDEVTADTHAPTCAGLRGAR